MKLINGNLISLAQQGYFDVIVHGCNCFNTMGAGIARTIAEVFPEAEKADLETNMGDKNKLGMFSLATHNREVNGETKPLTIINAYTQYGFGRDKDHFEYEHFKTILKSLKELYPNETIGLPLIGCGLAGGNKTEILNLIRYHLEGMNVTVVVFDNNQ